MKHKEKESFFNESLRPLSAPPIANLLNVSKTDLIYSSYYKKNSRTDVRLPLPNFFFSGQSYLSSYFFYFNDCQCNSCEYCTVKTIKDIQTPKKSLVGRMNEDFPSDVVPYTGVSRCNTPIGKRKEPVNMLFNDISIFIKSTNQTTKETIINLCKDQEASRFIQKRLDNCTQIELDWLFDIISNYLMELSCDLFGNYIVQKYIYSHGEMIYDILKKKLSILSYDIYGCRVVQKLLDLVVFDLREEFEKNVIELTKDQNGNHVIQKIIETSKTNLDFLVREFEGSTIEMCKHKYGCRAIQKLLEFLSSKLIRKIILENISELIYDQYGNYVIQHLITEETKEILDFIGNNVMKLSCHKFASNVIEKSISITDKHLFSIGNVIVDKNNLILLANSGYGNYVLQRMIESKDKRIRDCVKGSLTEIKKCVYAKQVISKIYGL